MSVHLAKSPHLANIQADGITEWGTKLIDAVSKIQREAREDKHQLESAMHEGVVKPSESLKRPRTESQGPFEYPAPLGDSLSTSQVTLVSAQDDRRPNNYRRILRIADFADESSHGEAEGDLSSAHPDLTPAPGQSLFERASLEGTANVFNRQMCSAIRRVKLECGLKAAITTVFPFWAGAIDCFMSLEIHQSSVVWLAMALFNAKVELARTVWHITLNEGITLVIPNSEPTLKGVLDEAIVNVFGPEIREAVTESPIRKKELEDGKCVTDCVSMILTSDGAIINLVLGLDSGVKMRNKLYI